MISKTLNEIIIRTYNAMEKDLIDSELLIDSDVKEYLSEVLKRGISPTSIPEEN